MDAVISPAFASVGTQVTITLRAFNPGSRMAEWNSGCGMDLGFEILDAQGHVAETPLFGVCTAELRQLRLNPGESMERRINWRLGFTVPASRLPDGRYQVRGLLGLDERGRRPGSVAALEIKRKRNTVHLAGACHAGFLHRHQSPEHVLAGDSRYATRGTPPTEMPGMIGACRGGAVRPVLRRPATAPSPAPCAPGHPRANRAQDRRPRGSPRQQPASTAPSSARTPIAWARRS